MKSDIEKLKKRYEQARHRDRQQDRAGEKETASVGTTAKRGFLHEDIPVPEQSGSVSIVRKARDEDLLPPLRELKELVADCPVVIDVSGCEPKALFDKGFNDARKAGRIRGLLMDSIVIDFLYLHHAKRIHRGNFDAGLFRGRFGATGGAGKI